MEAIKGVSGIVAVTFLGTMLLCCSKEEQRTIEQMKEVPTTGFVLQPEEGEVLLLRRPPIGAQVTLKVDPMNTGSMRVAMGTQRLPVRYRIPVHRHEYQDEILFVHEGKGTGIVGNERVPLEPGTTIYVPQGVWHGVENTSDAPAQIIWVIAPPGLERFFRDIGELPGTEREPLTEEEMVEINRRHGITVKIE